MTATITTSTLESAAVTFFGGFFGYLAAAGFALSGADAEHGAIVGAVAALAVLGYHAVSGNVKPAA